MSYLKQRTTSELKARLERLLAHRPIGMPALAEIAKIERELSRRENLTTTNERSR